MKYTAHFTITWHDTDANRILRPTQLMVYFQETANLQLKDNGVSLDELRDTKGLAFLLSKATVRIYEPLYAYDEINVETWICEGHGLSYDRCFRMLRGEQVVAEAFTVWGLLDLRERRLLRAGEFSYPFGPELPLDKSFTARVRYPALAGMEFAGERTIVYSDIDYNGHMNNTRYPDMLCDFTPDIRRLRVTGMSLSFLHEAAFGHTLKVYRQAAEGGYCFRTVDEDGNTCVEAALLLEDVKNVKA